MAVFHAIVKLARACTTSDVTCSRSKSAVLFSTSSLVNVSSHFCYVLSFIIAVTSCSEAFVSASAGEDIRADLLKYLRAAAVTRVESKLTASLEV